MSGIEPAAVVATAAQASARVGRILKGSEAEQAAIRALAVQAPGAALAGAAMAQRMAAKQLAINRLFAPLFWFAGHQANYFNSGEFEKDLSEKLAAVPDENVVSPAPNVAVQALEGLSYSIDDPDLKSMYLNLLATASSSETAARAHPAFASIIRQLSAAEASVLPLALRNRRGVAVAEIRSTLGNGGKHQVLERHVADLRVPGSGDPALLADWALFVDNWARLGLVEISYSKFRADEASYAFVTSRPEYLSATPGAGRTITFQRGLIIPTDLGSAFAKAVLPEIESPTIVDQSDTTSQPAVLG